VHKFSIFNSSKDFEVQKALFTSKHGLFFLVASLTLQSVMQFSNNAGEIMNTKHYNRTFIIAGCLPRLLQLSFYRQMPLFTDFLQPPFYCSARGSFCINISPSAAENKLNIIKKKRKSCRPFTSLKSKRLRCKCVS
jgi:hypothetical protein